MGRLVAVGRRKKIAVLYKRRVASYLLRQNCDVPQSVRSGAANPRLPETDEARVDGPQTTTTPEQTPLQKETREKNVPKLKKNT